MKYLRIRSLSGRWIDKDEILLHAAFQLLQDYVEQERPDRYIEWNHDRAHAKAWREIRSLYRWWTKVRPARKRPLDDKTVKHPPFRFQPVPGKRNVSRLVPYDKRKYRAYERAARAQIKDEAKWHAEDQKNLHRLVEIRGFLWT